MTDLSIAKKLLPYKPKHKVRFVTAASLFDGHDASINIMRRILQSTGAEVIHLGHNRSVQEIVNAALQEDVQGIAITSYQGGHVEFFKYMIDLLKAGGGENIQVFGGGGGVIVPSEIDELHAYGVARVYSPQDGQSMGLQGMINELMAKSDIDIAALAPKEPDAVLAALKAGNRRKLAQIISALENGAYPETLRKKILHAADGLKVPVLGITGTGGAGKSSLTDELVRRFRLDQGDSIKLAIVSIDPSRKRTGGALLGDRIRMNAIEHPNIYMRSLATRETGSEVSAALPEVIAACKLAGFDFVIVETSGIGQGNAAIVPLVDVSLYVMTPEFGAASQLEKIDMLDFADFVAINKFDRKGAEDALRDVRKQYQRNHEAFSQSPDEMPVFGTMAARFHDDGVTALYQAMASKLHALGLKLKKGRLPLIGLRHSSNQRAIVPAKRVRYLAEIAETVRNYHAHTAAQAEIARQRQSLRTAKELFESCGKPADDFAELITLKDGQLDARARKLLDMWPKTVELYAQDEYVVKIRDKEIRTRLTNTSLSGTRIRKVSLPSYRDDGEVLRFLMKENVPGSFPFTAGVFAFKRENEDPTRMFAGEGDAFRTNRRFKKVSEGMPAKRLSTAFDSVTLYGCDPDARPDIYGKVGNSGVSIATLDDMKVLFDGFELCAPTTSVSLTINGPAPIILSMFFNAAIDQQVDKFRVDNDRDPTEDEMQKIRVWVLANVRGTVQADILKEDQGQNTCIFSTEFALKMMGDIQEFFVHNQIGNFYSVSISGYHIAEAGANPISQLAFTLANGFTYVETYLARGMHIDDFAPNLSFFFSNGMDPEYSVIGRVARRIWAVAMKNKYGGNERSQKLKYHIQTSGRSLHAQEMAFNDIRTTLQALIAIYDNCNSLHTNAYDEAITTPTEESVRRAMAIQLIINREWGLAMNENPNQGSFIIEELTDLVEEAVLKEFEAISGRGGVLGAMETGYQRGKIQEESLYYEHKKHDGSFPIVGVNTFRNPKGDAQIEIELARSTEDEKQSQLARLHGFQSRNAAASGEMLERLKQSVIGNENVFAVLMDAVRVCSLGQITGALYEVGGQYRRSM
ncbi:MULTISPECIES: fused isobutyryl-CoA mutase/GTPase IcmF [Candidatus Accumulibacter]|uniref:Fused isobutyryl-CoA mutase n=5 Tax=Candidatus Accumulibacter TaxID=327159 RepID=A0A080M829_9PROT|nr:MULTISPECIES: fused isobutyryl-CoA mutase/GTPase IcmF [Candidatus Accumulibacter]KFB77383.1 MAG: Methylmalonyl-CoA mutase [Candidatus Accumulibacter cognatus]MCM8621041.1 methylmalonyl-CoA mutase family protein [Accumulibacter sp.]TMQ76392.1 B12 binding domain / kinase domain / Methylmalonyl-CoA mutase [Candidatus Accumulibacter phosphatis]HNC19978.1 methylmalonyl-CoA mutase family protein [Accumulibacter sp.]